MPARSDGHIRELSAHSGDATLFVRSVGGYDGGPALVLLHGGPGISHEYMLPLEVLATEDLRVVSYDQRAVGRSGGSVTSDPMRDYADDLEAVRQTIGVEFVHLLGHSAGGWPAMGYAAHYPEHVASVIFVDSVPPTRTQLHQGFECFETLIAQLQAEGVIPQTLPEDPTEQIEAFLPVYFANPRHPKALQGLNGARGYPVPVIDNLGEFDLRPALAKITMPTLSFISKVPFGVDFAGELADELPQANSRRILMEECGHFPWLECPEWFVSEVTTFLEPLLE